MNHAYSQGTFNRFYKEFDVWLAALRVLRELSERFGSGDRTQVLNLCDYNANMKSTGCTLSGVDYGTNTTEDGKIYVRITGGGPYTVTLYKTTGGGGSDAVASGSANANNTATLTASNSSGLTGTFDLAASITAEADDKHYLLPIVDFRARARKTWTEDGTVTDDGDSIATFRTACAQAEAYVLQAKAAILAGLLAWGKDRGNDFLGTDWSTLLSEAYSSDADGNVTVLRTGVLPSLKADSADNTTAQYVVKRGPSAAGGTAGSSNAGVGTISAHTPGDQCPAGTLTLYCTDGVDTLGTSWKADEKFSGFFVPSDVTKPKVMVSEPLTVGKTWAGPHGLAPSITRTYSKTETGTNLDVAVATACTFTGASGTNTNAGVLYGYVDDNGANWDFSFYSDSARTQLVSKATNIATSAVFTASSQNGSGLTVSWQAGSGPTADHTFTISCQPFKAQNTSGAPDQFTVVVTCATPGLIAQTIAEEIGAPMSGTTSSSETWADAEMKAGTFPDFAVTDN